MQITLEKLFLAQSGLTKLLSQDLSVAMAFRLSRLLKAAKPELDSLEESRIKLVRQYGVEVVSEGKTNIQVPPDKMPQFTEELQKLTSVQINLDFEPISLQDISDAKLSAVDVVNLEPFLKD